MLQKYSSRQVSTHSFTILEALETVTGHQGTTLIHYDKLRISQVSSLHSRGRSSSSHIGIGRYHHTHQCSPKCRCIANYPLGHVIWCHCQCLHSCSRSSRQRTSHGLPYPKLRKARETWKSVRSNHQGPAIPASRERSVYAAAIQCQGREPNRDGRLRRAWRPRIVPIHECRDRSRRAQFSQSHYSAVVLQVGTVRAQVTTFYA